MQSTDAVPAAPRTLSETSRRALAAADGRFGLSTAIGLLLIGGILSFYFCRGVAADIRLDGSATSVEAVVLSLKDAGWRTNDQQAETVEYQFSAAGQIYTGSTDMLHPPVRGSGDWLKVEYLPGNPTVSRVAGSTMSQLGIFGLLFLVIPLVGIGLLVVTMLARRQRAHVYVHGIPVLAKVISAGEERSVENGDLHPFVVRWEFQLGDRKLEGAHSTLNPGDLQALANEPTVVVLYDPSDPSANVLWVA